MTTKVPPSKANAPKPPIVSSAARGHLNVVESEKDSHHTISQWKLRESHSRGYDYSSLTMREIYEALGFALQVIQAPNAPRTRALITRYQQPEHTRTLRAAVSELLAQVAYNEDRWQEEGKMRFREGDDWRKLNFTVRVTPYISPEKGVYSPLGENKTDDLTTLPM